MDTESLLQESRAENCIEPLGFITESGKTQFKKQLRLFTANTGILKRRQETILSVRKSLDSEKSKVLEGIFQEVHDIEPECSLFFNKTEVEKNSYEQLLFSDWPSLQILNTIPFLLLCLSFFKQYIVPAMAVFTPIFIFVMPFIFLKYWTNLPISMEQYMKIFMGAFGIQNLDMKNPRGILHGGLTLFSIGQSIYQPIQNALHLQTIHQEMMKKTQSLQRLVSLTDQCLRLFPIPSSFHNPLEDIQTQDAHRLFATFWDHPYRLRLALQNLGDCEVVYRLASMPNLHPVSFVKSQTPYMNIQEGEDPFLENCIPYQLTLGGNTHHAILTGPNRGGKSSVLRSSLLTVVMAQSFGFGFCSPEGTIHLRPFDWIATGLRLEDRPGTTSMFEREVEFATQILKRAKQYPEQVGCVFFDELFHSTNPPDGVRTAEIFLEQLWKQSNTASMISTHVFRLAKKSPRHIQKLCVPAFKKEDGSLHFTYTLKRGICEVSSVDEILREKGLICV